MSTTKTKKRHVPTEAEKAAADERKRELLANLTEKVESLRTSEGWQAWLTVAAKFHTYSLHNQLLILLQRPDATHVAGYRKWQELGRQVRKGEKGISILYPRKRVVRDEETDEVTGVRLTGFGVTSVFDVSQTDGDELPDDPSVRYANARQQVKSSLDGAWDFVHGLADSLGFEVVVEDESQNGAYGWFERGTTQVHVVNDTHDAMAKTLLHELSHAFDPGLAADTNRASRELVAESACWLAGQLFGLDTSAPSTEYLAGWGLDVKHAQIIAERVLQVVNTFENALTTEVQAELEVVA